MRFVEEDSTPAHTDAEGEKKTAAPTERFPSVRPSHNSSPKEFSFVTKLLILLIPMLAYAGWYTYTNVFGATYMSKTPDTNVNLESGLLLHYTFDGPYVNTASTTAEILDSGSNGLHGDWQNYGPGTSTVQTGKIGQGLYSRAYFVPSSPRIRVATTSLDDNLPMFTLAAWVKGNGQLFNKAYGNNTGWLLNITFPIIFYVDCPGADLSVSWTNLSIFDNGWHHILLTWTGGNASTTANLYIDGVQQSRDSGGTSCATRTDDSSRALHIGFTDTSNQSFSGTYDDVRIYTRVLSAAEIAELYRLGGGTKVNVTATTTAYTSVPSTGLVGHYTFDGGNLNWSSGSAEIVDKSGTGNNGDAINVGASGVKPGKVGQSLEVNGTSAYIDLGTPASLNLSSVNKFTLAAWVYPTAAPNGAGVISEMYSPSNATVQYEIGFDMDLPPSATSRLAIGFFDGSWKIVRDTSMNATLNEWVFISGTWDGTTLRLYRNGVEVTSGTPGGSLPSANFDGVVVGRRHDGAGTVNFFPGRIDDARIYNRTLSAAEIAQLYNQSAAAKAGLCGEGGVRDADGNVYGIVQIGTQCWLDRNMNVGTRVNVATAQTNNSTTEKWCYSDSASNCTANHPKFPDGGLYQWNEAMQYSTTEGVRGICPSGWHIPTDAEWFTLEDFLKDAGQSCDSGRAVSWACASAGTKLKSGGVSMFNGNIAGFGMSGVGTFNRDTSSLNWSSTESSTEEAIARGLLSTSSTTLRSSYDKAFGASVRCIKD